MNDITSKLIIERIAAIKERDARGFFKDEGGFRAGDGRWSSLEVEGTPIRDVDFSELAPDQLVYIFEHIVRRLYVQR